MRRRTAMTGAPADMCGCVTVLAETAWQSLIRPSDGFPIGTDSPVRGAPGGSRAPVAGPGGRVTVPPDQIG